MSDESDHSEGMIINYRVKALEDQVSSAILGINDKLDELISLYRQGDKDLALVDQRHEQLISRVGAHDSRLSKLEDDVVDVRMGLAEKIGPGAVVAALISGLGLLFQYFF